MVNVSKNYTVPVKCIDSHFADSFSRREILTLEEYDNYSKTYKQNTKSKTVETIEWTNERYCDFNIRITELLLPRYSPNCWGLSVVHHDTIIQKYLGLLFLLLFHLLKRLCIRTNLFNMSLLTLKKKVAFQYGFIGACMCVCMYIICMWQIASCLQIHECPNPHDAWHLLTSKHL